MPLAPTFLIYRSGFAPTNGTSVQMQRLFGGMDESLVHLMWDEKDAGRDSVRWVVRVDDGFNWSRPFTRVGWSLRRLKGLLFPLWWRAEKLNVARLERALAPVPLHPRQAYVVCYNEREAKKACALWEAVGCPPFVLHIMDVLHPELSEKETPVFARLARSAAEVLCLNRLIEVEVKKVGARATRVFPLVSNLENVRREVPASPLKVIISGALYASADYENVAMALLREVWPRVKEAFPGAELHYSGASSQGLPAELRSDIHDHGLLEWKAYKELLHSCHLAYVPVSHVKESSLRFSMPSRIPDYLISGLPVIACTDEETGIHEFFQTTPRECTRLVRTSEDFFSALQEFAGDSDRWQRASDMAVTYSAQTFAVEPAREALFALLNQAGKEGPVAS